MSCILRGLTKRYNFLQLGLKQIFDNYFKLRLQQNVGCFFGFKQFAPFFLLFQRNFDFLNDLIQLYWVYLENQK
jgi:hypothetical protein